MLLFLLVAGCLCLPQSFYCSFHIKVMTFDDESDEFLNADTILSTIHALPDFECRTNKGIEARTGLDMSANFRLLTVVFLFSLQISNGSF
jgi:hypothetical protein